MTCRTPHIELPEQFENLTHGVPTKEEEPKAERARRGADGR